ncbi:MAG: hypothetical protein CML16_01215 [Pusillimonas sp.]|nr:hypothetical protein [Pusillimonas sp.]|tara:strand:- start:10082 stop:11449 length:1368 start_codon:yes stop_codon:yes gene_type:complete
MDYFDIQNDKFYDFLNQTFDLRKCKNWDDVAKNITQLKVKRTYRVFAELYPRKFDYSTELGNLKSTFSSIHYSTLKANRIIDEIVRFSLYSDKILVFHPLQNPSVTNQNIDPRRNAKRWLPDFLDALYFYIVIQKWVKAGIVKLVINPCEYDFDLRDEIDKQIKERLLKLNPDDFFEVGKESAKNHLAEQFAIYSKNKSKDQIIQDLLLLQNPVFTNEEAESFADKVLEHVSKTNPLWDKIDKSNFNKDGMMAPMKSGGSIEAMQYVSKLTGGNIYTPSDTVWHQMKQLGVNDFWMKTNHLYSQMPLTFLNNVDTAFALKIRQEGRLEGVRQELKKIYGELSKIDINKLDEQKIKFIQEGFTEEIKKAESEWDLIKKQANLSRKHWASANIGVPLIINEVSILPLAVASLAWLYKNEKTSLDRQKAFRIQKPISVYLDLKNKKQDFVTELRNCII